MHRKPWSESPLAILVMLPGLLCSCALPPPPARRPAPPLADQDRDGVDDARDRCPKQPGPARHLGCPAVDRDRDGVVDGRDACPDLPAEAGSDQKGCPSIRYVSVTAQQIELLKPIYFKVVSSVIHRRSYLLLNQVVAVLKVRSRACLRVEVHTNARSTRLDRSYSMPLSQHRANAIRAYLIHHGIDSRRLTARGMGYTRPLFSPERSPDDARANRRTELHFEPCPRKKP